MSRCDGDDVDIYVNCDGEHMAKEPIHTELNRHQLSMLIREGAGEIQTSLHNGVPTRKWLIEQLEELLRLAKSLPV